MDFATVGSRLGSLKTATEIAKFIKDSDLTLEKAETKLKLAELVSALADAKLEAAEIQQAILDRDEKIRSLEADAKLKGDLKWNEPIYERKSPEGENEAYCQNCYDKDGRLARLHSDGAGLYKCRVCNQIFKTRERAAKDGHEFKAAMSRRSSYLA